MPDKITYSDHHKRKTFDDVMGDYKKHYDQSGKYKTHDEIRKEVEEVANRVDREINNKG